jgi:putative ABC transport system ATP-binding protein
MKIEVRQAVFRYPARAFALRVPSLHLAAGEDALLTGPSGSGKSTLLRLLAGLHRPQEGAVVIDDREMNQWQDDEVRRWRADRVGFVFQNFRLLPYLDVGENIRLPYRLNPRRRWSPEDSPALDALLERAGLASCRSRAVHTLSEGEKQRVAVCRALLTRPGLVLADEPTGNLDADNRDRVIDLLASECRASGATLLVVSHDTAMQSRFTRHLHLPDLLSGHD